MDGTFFLVLLALAGLVFLWRFFRIPAAFVIAIREGTPELVSGKVSDRFLGECELLCRTWKIDAGTIRGVLTGGGHVSLRFSREIGPEHHQRFRNVFHAA